MSLHFSTSSLATRYSNLQEHSAVRDSETYDRELRPLSEISSVSSSRFSSERTEPINNGTSGPNSDIELNSPVLYGSDPAEFASVRSSLNGRSTPDVSIENNEVSRNHTNPKRKQVKWGVPRRKPGFMVLFLVFGLLVMLAHQIYYQSLDGTSTSDVARQQWPGRFGTAFAFLVSSSLVSATVASFNQYIWVIFRRKGLTVRGINKLYLLPADPSSFFSLELVKYAPVSVFLGFLIWCLPLSALAPPATLSVVSALRNQPANKNLPEFNWSGTWYDRSQDTGSVSATSTVLEIANLAAQTMNVLQLLIPSLNSSYQVEFFGPTVQCLPPNKVQQAAFDEVIYLACNSSYAIGSNFGWFSQDCVGGDSVPGVAPDFTTLPLLVYSSWSPFLSLLEIGETASSAVGRNDTGSKVITSNTPNNWIPTSNVLTNLSSSLNSQHYQELWVQTSNQSIVCTLVNASFLVELSNIDGIQSIVSQEVRLLNILQGVEQSAQSQISTQNPYNDPYTATFIALSGILNGNLTIGYDIDGGGVDDSLEGFATDPSATNIILTGLVTCDDIVNNFWAYYPNENQSLTNPNDLLFAGEPWMCRNRSLARAIEDLANNITISMLSSANLTQPGTTPTLVNITTPINIYQYNSQNLIISYGIGLFFAILAVIIGLASFATNGVSHSTSFSAMIAATRNRKLDELMEGYSLGDAVKDEKIAKTRLKFGAIKDAEGGEGENVGEKDVRRVAWGLEDDVVSLKKGGVYI